MPSDVLKQGAATDIIVIDDEADVRVALKKYMATKGLNVIEAESGVHLMKLLERRGWSWIPNAIICDIVMPNTAGYDLIRRLNERYRAKKVPLVIISRLGTREDVLEAELAGAHAYITKPFKPAKLLTAIDQVRENFNRSVDDQIRKIIVVG